MNSKYVMTELISEEQIRRRVMELGRQIKADYAGKSLMLVGVLKGSIVFLSDLIREISAPLEISFLLVSSYEEGVATSGAVRLLCDLDQPLRDKHVLIVEDIIDSGYTLAFLMKTLMVRQPASIKVCSLLDKPSRRLARVTIDYVGFEIADEFAVGYGMDYAGEFRNLKNIMTIHFEQ